MSRRWLFAAIILAVPSAAWAQASGTFTAGHVLVATTPSGIPYVDGGPASGGGITELGIRNTGTPLCIDDAVKTGAYHELCFGANSLGGGLIAYNAYGGAAALGLNFNINGATYAFPGNGQGNILGPNSSTIGHLAIFNNTAGTLLADSGITLSGASGTGNVVLATSPTIATPTITNPTITGGATISGVTALNASGDITSYNLGSWQVSPIKGNLVFDQTYTDLYTAFPNIFQIASFARMNGSSNVVSVFGQCESIKAIDVSLFGACWGANFVGIASVNGAHAQALEIDSENQYGDGAVVYNLVMSAFGPSSGAAQAYKSQNAISIQAGNATGVFIDGILFNDINHTAVTGSLVKAAAATVAEFGLNFLGAYSTAEISVPSFAVGATPVNINSSIRVSGSASGNPSIQTRGAGASPATNGNLILASLGSGAVEFLTEGATGKLQLLVADTPSAVNYLEVTGGSAGNQPTITAKGTDTNIGIGINPKGNGAINTTAAINAGGLIQFSGLGTTPGGKQPVCIDASTGLLYKGSGGAC